MAKFIVTGGAGFLGSHLVDTLIDHNHDVVVLDNLVTGRESNLAHHRNNPKLRFIQADVSDPWPDVESVDGIFHMASPASPDDFDPLALEILKVGSNGTWNGLEYARKHKAWFFLASTSEVYGDPLIHPQREEYNGNVNIRGVRSVYDESKRFSESLTSAYQRKGYVRTSTVRIFNTYGPRMRANDGRVIPNFIGQALKNEPLTVYGNGQQTRSFCYVSDLIRGIYAFWTYQPTEPINLGNPIERTVVDAAKIIISETGSKSELTFRPLPQHDPKQRCPDSTRANEILRWQPEITFEKGIAKTVEYFRGLL